MRGALLAVALLPLTALADIVSPAPESVRVTIYRDATSSLDGVYEDQEDVFDDDAPGGLVMVSETRTIDLPAGDSRVILLGVADAIVPQTAAIEGLPATVLESNFDYDLLTPGALIAKSHGERVRLVRTDPARGRTIEREAIVRTGPEGVLLDLDGKTEALGCSGLREKLIFPRVPPGLADQPKLSMTARAATAGRHTVQLTYLALGIDWSADYVARIDPDGRTLNLTGWITLVNRAGTTFANTPAEVVAGTLSRDEEQTQPPGPTALSESDSCWPIGVFGRYASYARRSRVAAELPMPMRVRGFVDSLQEVVVTGSRVPQAQLRELGDYKLYALPEPTTIAARQSKQVLFLSQARVPFTRIYQFIADEDSLADESDRVGPRPPITLLRLKNEESDGLGKPLPSGVMSVMEANGSGAALAGQDRIEDTPVGLPFELKLGRAMDVWVEPRVTDDRDIELRDGHSGNRVDIEVRLGNDKPVPITLEYRQPSLGESFRIVRESRSHTLKDGYPLWSVRLRPGERAVLRYSMQWAD